MKRLFVLAAALLLASCGGQTSSSTPASSASSSQSASTSSVISSETSSEASTTVSSETSSEASSELSSEVSSSSSSEESTTASSQSGETQTWTVTSDDVADPVSGGYPSAYDVTVSGRTLNFTDVMKGDKGKGSDDKKTMQIRKETALIASKEGGYTGLTIIYYKNYVERTESDYTGSFTVYTCDSINGTYQVQETTKTETTYLGQNAYQIEATFSGSFLKIANESSYAINAYSIALTYVA